MFDEQRHESVFDEQRHESVFDEPRHESVFDEQKHESVFDDEEILEMRWNVKILYSSVMYCVVMALFFVV